MVQSLRLPVIVHMCLSASTLVYQLGLRSWCHALHSRGVSNAHVIGAQEARSRKRRHCCVEETPSMSRTFGAPVPRKGTEHVAASGMASQVVRPYAVGALHRCDARPQCFILFLAKCILQGQLPPRTCLSVHCTGTCAEMKTDSRRLTMRGQRSGNGNVLLRTMSVFEYIYIYIYIYGNR